MNQPDPRKHQLISFAKSGIRIGASGMVTFLAVTGAGTPLALIAGLAAGYGVAELIGIWEELV